MPTPTLPPPALPADLQQFCEAYRAAFDALDGIAVAGLYAEPSAIAQGGRVTVWPDRTAVAANMTALCRLYAGRGHAGARFEPVHLRRLGEHQAFVDLRWTIAWTDGGAPWVFHTAYNLVREPPGWRVALCTAYVEDRLAAASTP